MQGQENSDLSAKYLNAFRHKHQGSFRENRNAIFRGEFPDRYVELAGMTPGRRVLDVGSADGTFAMALCKAKEKVYGVDYTPERFETAKELQRTLVAIDECYSKCSFEFGKVQDHLNILSDVDTVTFIRVAYYLPMRDIVREIIKNKNVKTLVICGSLTKEERIKSSWFWSGVRREFWLASERGLISFFGKQGLNDFEIRRMSTTGDPVAIVHL